MKGLTVNQIYKIANKIYNSKELDKISDITDNNDRRDHALNVLSLPELCYPVFKERNYGDELNLYNVGGRIHYYITNTWDYGASQPVPLTNEILKTFEVDEEAFKMLEKFGIEC